MLKRKQPGLVRKVVAPELEIPDSLDPEDPSSARGPNVELLGASSYPGMYKQASNIAHITSFQDLGAAMEKTSRDLQGTPEGNNALGQGSALIRKAATTGALPGKPGEESGLQAMIRDQAKEAGTSVTDSEPRDSTSTWQKLSNAFDYLPRRVRAALNPDLAYDPESRANDSGPWKQALRRNVQEVEAGRHPAGPLAGATKLAEHLGAPLDYAAGALGTGMGLAVDAASMGAKPDFKAALENIKNPVRGTGQNIALDLGTDPLSYVGIGTAGEGATALKQATRGLRASGVDAAEAAKAIQKIVETTGPLEKGAQVLEAFKAAGGTEAEALKRFGKNAEKLGKPGLKVGSFLGHGGVELSDILPSLSERPLLSGIERVREKIAPVLGKTYLDPLKRQAFKQEISKEFHGAMQKTHEGLSDYGNTVAPHLPATKAEREAFAQDILHPAVAPQNMSAEDTARKASYDSFMSRRGEAPNTESGSFVPDQTKGLPLQTLAEHGVKAKYDPHEIVHQWLPQKETAVAQDNLQHYLADHFASNAAHEAPMSVQAGNSHVMLQNSEGKNVYVPRDLAEKVDAVFRQSSGSLTLDRIMNPVMQHFKEMNLFPAPRYHINNMMGDSVLMAAGGLRDPHISEVSKLFNEKIPGNAALFKSPSGRVWTKERLAGEMKLYGAYDAQGGGRFDVGPYQSKRQILRGFQEASEVGQGQKASALTRGLRRAPEFAKDILSGGVPGASPLRAGKAIAGAWENQSNAMFVIDRLKKGDSMSSAIMHLREVKPDYVMKGPLAKFLKRAFPFAQWQIETGKNLPQNIARAPWLVNAPQHIAQDLVGAENQELQNPGTPNFQERGPNIPLNTGARGLVRKTLEKVGGDKIAAGQGINMLLRHPIYEGEAPLGGIMEGSPDAAIGLAGPATQLGANLVAQKNLFTGRDQKRISGSSIFNPGHGPVSMQAEPGQLSWMELLSSLGIAPASIMGANRATQQPLTSPMLGPGYGPSEFSNTQAAKAFLQLMTGVPLELNNPMSQYQGLSEELEKAGKIGGATKGLIRKRQNMPKKAE